MGEKGRVHTLTELQEFRIPSFFSASMAPMKMVKTERQTAQSTSKFVYSTIREHFYIGNVEHSARSPHRYIIIT